MEALQFMILLLKILNLIKDAEKIKVVVELALRNGYACSFDFEEEQSESND